MISFDEALNAVLNEALPYGEQTVSLEDSLGKVLAETISADRDFPPFDRATKDGIAIRFEAYTSKGNRFKVVGIAQAGSPQVKLESGIHCIEVMTGAILPENTDTVIMYEHTRRENDHFTIEEPIEKGQNIHKQASDVSLGDILLYPGTSIGPEEIGVLATVGKSKVQVQKMPRVAIITTGNELVDVNETPKPYQIRKSNSHTLSALLKLRGITADTYHYRDELKALRENLSTLLSKYDVFILSGGVSKGKYDFLPDTFDALGVEKIFHRILQRPGKPFWFGKHQKTNTLIFSFPGNPVSTYVNYHAYFLPWLNKTLGRKTIPFSVLLEKPMENPTDMTLFKGVTLRMEKGSFYASTIKTTGSGDLLSLSKADGFIQLNPKQKVSSGDVVPLLCSKSKILSP